MELKFRKHEDIFIIDVHGEMDLYNAHTLKDVFAKMLQKQVEKFIICMEHVDYIDSSGVGILIGVYATVKQKNLRFYLTNVHGTVQKVLTLTKLNGFFPAAATVEEAVGLMKAAGS